MNHSAKKVCFTVGSGFKVGMFIISFGLSIIALAYIILALEAARRVPGTALMAVLYETAWALGWMSAAIGTLVIALSLKKVTIGSERNSRNSEHILTQEPE